MRIWHDNSGAGQYASWYLRHIVVQDLQTKEKFVFIATRWFAVEERDGQVCLRVHLGVWYRVIVWYMMSI